MQVTEGPATGTRRFAARSCRQGRETRIHPQWRPHELSFASRLDCDAVRVRAMAPSIRAPSSIATIFATRSRDVASSSTFKRSVSRRPRISIRSISPSSRERCDQGAPGPTRRHAEGCWLKADPRSFRPRGVLVHCVCVRLHWQGSSISGRRDRHMTRFVTHFRRRAWQAGRNPAIRRRGPRNP